MSRRIRPLASVASIVFSRDRAFQLDAFLESVRRYARPLLDMTTVVFRTTSAEHAQAYDLLRRDWWEVAFREQADFRTDVIGSIGGQPFTVFHTDDDLFFRNVDGFFLDDEIACFSFRLGLNTTYCYPLDFDETIQPEEMSDDWMTWRWRAHGRGAFGYPLALNGHVFRTTDVERWLADAAFANPNELEVALQSFTEEVPALMASFRESRLVNIPTNLVNESFANRHAAAHTTTSLNDRYLRGERLDLDAMDFARVHAAHEELEYVFRYGR
jgi:hypothetical protein